MKLGPVDQAWREHRTETLGLLDLAPAAIGMHEHSFYAGAAAVLISMQKAGPVEREQHFQSLLKDQASFAAKIRERLAAEPPQDATGRHRRRRT